MSWWYQAPTPSAGGGPTTFFQDLTVSATYSVTLQKQANKALALAATFTAAIVKLVSKLLSIPQISIKVLLDEGSSANQTSYTTSLFSPAANRWLVLDFANSVGAGTPNEPTISSGGGLSYTTEGTRVGTVGSGPQRRVTRFYAWTGNTPGSFTVTFDLAGQTNLNGYWVIYEVVGADPSDLFVQTVVNSSSGTTASATLAAFADTRNRAVAFTQCGSDYSGNEGTFLGGGGGEVKCRDFWIPDAVDTTPSATLTVSAEWKIIASEIAIDPGWTVTLGKQVNKTLAVAVTYAVSLAKTVLKNLAVGISNAVSLVTEFIPGAGGTTFPKALNLTVTYTPILIRQVNKVLAVGVTYSVTAVRGVLKNLSLGATYAATLTKGLLLQKALSVVVTYAVTLAPVKVLAKIIEGFEVAWGSMGFGKNRKRRNVRPNKGRTWR